MSLFVSVSKRISFTAQTSHRGAQSKNLRQKHSMRTARLNIRATSCTDRMRALAWATPHFLADKNRRPHGIGMGLKKNDRSEWLHMLHCRPSFTRATPETA